MFTSPNLSHVTCQVSRVTCHVSHVMCHVSLVTCHMSHVTLFFFGQSGEAYCWRVCYQRGLPRLVLDKVQYSDNEPTHQRNLIKSYNNLFYEHIGHRANQGPITILCPIKDSALNAQAKSTKIPSVGGSE